MFTYSIKRACEIRKVHVVVVQKLLRNVQKSIMHMQSCCFAYLNICLFCCSPSSLQKLPIVVIQKFYYHGNMTSQFTSPFSYLFSLLHNLIFIYFNQWLFAGLTTHWSDPTIFFYVNTCNYCYVIQKPASCIPPPPPPPLIILLSSPSSSVARSSTPLTPLLWNKDPAETYNTCLTPYLALL